MKSLKDLTPSFLSKYSKYDDRELINMYRETADSVYISVILFRYEPLLFKIISQWHRKYGVYLNESDSDDVMQCAYLGVLNLFIKVKNVNNIKNVGTRIKSYIYNALNDQYKHRKFESLVDIVDTSRRYDEAQYEFELNFTDEFQYLCFHYQYDYYKLGLMYYGTTSRKNMRFHVSRKKKKMRSDLALRR